MSDVSPDQNSNHHQPHAQHKPIQIPRGHVQHDIAPAAGERHRDQAHYEQHGSHKTVKTLHPQQHILQVLAHQRHRGEAHGSQDARQQGTFKATGGDAARMPELGSKERAGLGVTREVSLQFPAVPSLVKDVTDQDVDLVAVLRVRGALQPAAQLEVSFPRGVLEGFQHTLHWPRAPHIHPEFIWLH